MPASKHPTGLGITALIVKKTQGVRIKCMAVPVMGISLGDALPSSYSGLHPAIPPPSQQHTQGIPQRPLWNVPIGFLCCAPLHQPQRMARLHLPCSLRRQVQGVCLPGLHGPAQHRAVGGQPEWRQGGGPHREGGACGQLQEEKGRGGGTQHGFACTAEKAGRGQVGCGVYTCSRGGLLTALVLQWL